MLAERFRKTRQIGLDALAFRIPVNHKGRLTRPEHLDSPRESEPFILGIT